MASKKISQLTATTTTNSTDETVLAVSGTTRKITLSNLINGLVKLITTSAKGLTGVNDSNDNEVVVFTGVASAVNEVTITNATTGNKPTISATGGDTNIDLSLKGKGSGAVTFGTANIKLPNSDGSTGQYLKTDGSGTTSFTSLQVKTGITTTATTHTVTHNLGYVPSLLRFSSITKNGTNNITFSTGVYSGGSSYVIAGHTSTSNSQYATSNGDNRVVIIDLNASDNSPSDYFTVGTITSTQFTLTRTGSGKTINVLWEVM